MKKLILTVVLFLLVAGCSDKYSASIWGDNELGVRIGNYIDANRVEVGATLVWRNEEEVPASIGVYGIRYLPIDVNVPNPFRGDFLPDSFNGKPYFGITIDRNLDLDITEYAPITGVVFEKFLFFGYDIDEQRPTLGLKYDF